MNENGKKWQVIYDLIRTMKDLTKEDAPGEYTFSCLRNPVNGIWTAELRRRQGVAPSEVVGRALTLANPKPLEVAQAMAEAAPTLYKNAAPLMPNIELLGDFTRANPHAQG